jgi:hypothetical protein
MARYSRLLPFVLAGLLCGCAPSGRVSTYRLGPGGMSERIDYSEYFECMGPIADGKVDAHVLLTLGKERVPKGHVFDRPIQGSQGDIACALEIYFSNRSDARVHLADLSFSGMRYQAPLAPSPMEIPPGAYVKTEPLVRITSVFTPNAIPFVLTYTYADRTRSITGTLNRLTVDELKARAKSKQGR